MDKERLSSVQRVSREKEAHSGVAFFQTGRLFCCCLALWFWAQRRERLLGCFFPCFRAVECCLCVFRASPLWIRFLSCFSTLLLNALIGLLPLFLLGLTAFGIFAVPAFLFFRGVTVGLGVSFFLWRDELWGLLHSALIYTPAAAASGVLLLLFAVRSLVFSRYLAKAGFSAHGASLDFKLYLSSTIGSSLSCAVRGFSGWQVSQRTVYGAFR